MPSYADGFLNLRVNRDKLKGDIEAAAGKVDGGPAGRTFGDGFSKESIGRMNAGLARFAQDSARAGDQAGAGHGQGFAAGFRKATAGLVTTVVQALRTQSAQSGQAGGLHGLAWGQGFKRGGLGPVREFHAQLAADSQKAGDTAGAGAGRAFAAAFIRLTRGLGGIGLPGGGGGGAARGLLGGIGPGILGLPARAAGIIGLGAAGLGAVPALAGVGAVAGLAGLGAGATAEFGAQVAGPAADLAKQQAQAQAAAGAATTATQRKAAAQAAASVRQQAQALDPAQRSMYATITQLQKLWQQFTTSFAPAFAKAMAPIPRLLQSILPALRAFFSGGLALATPLLTGLTQLAGVALPLLGQAFRAAAPLLAPLLSGLAVMLSGLLPGLIDMMRAAGPAVTVLSGFLAGLGTALGSMFSAFATVMGPSSRLLGALLGIVTQLLPVIGQLAAIMARALAPVFTQLAGAVQSLLPFVVTLGRILAGLAAAVLGDLVSAFRAVAVLFRSVAPALDAFARALGGVFTMLENSGVFAVLGNAIETLARPLGQMITTLLRGLTPILPPIIAAITQIAAILAGGLARAIAAVLPPLTQLASQVLAALAGMLPVLIPLFANLTRILSAVFVRAVTDLAVAFAFLIKALPPSVLQAIAYGVLAIWAAVKVGGLVMAVSSPLGLLITAVALLVIGITELATHWHRVWTDVKNWAVDAWHAIYGTVLAPLISWFTGSLPHGLGVAANHLHQWWSDTANAFSGGYHAVFNNTLAPFIRFFTTTIPAAYHAALSSTRQWWSDVAGAFRDGWNAIWQRTVVPMHDLFTRDLPSWFRAAVAAIGRWWGALGNVTRRPVAWVVDNVLNGLIGAFDWITSHIGLGSPIKPVHPFGLAAGGRIPGYGGGDRWPALLEGGEAVVDKRLTAEHAAELRAWGVPGMQSGGRVGQNPPPVNLHTGVATAGPSGGPDILGAVRHAAGAVLHKALDIGKITAALLTGNSAALTNAFSDFLGMRAPGAAAGMAAMLARVPRALVRDIVGWLMGHGGASGNAIADYAASWIGKIPYVWGGTQVPGGADCSGFVQAVLGHFNIQAPRTSEEQGAWVRRTGPVPGALALYHSPPGGPDPGHVGIVRNAAQVISQGGGMGPQLMGLHAMPLLWTGVPPHGFGTAAGGATAGTLSAGQIAQLWTAAGGPAYAAANMARIAYAESGDRPGAVQKGQPPGLTGWGLYQITPTSGIWQNGAFGNLLNAGNNTRAALSLFRASGYQPWAADPVGSSLTRGGLGYAKGGWINEPVTGIGAYSRALYRFGEAGRELVVPEGQAAGGGGWGLLAARLDRVIGLLDAGPARTAAGIAAAGAGPARLAAHSAWLAAR